MLKYLTHKLKTQSINEEDPKDQIDQIDSGTESDDLDDTEDFNVRDIELREIELNMCSRNENSPTDTDTACSLESPAFLSPKCNLRLYDHHSSEEELEVINLTFGGNLMDNLTTTLSCSVTKSQDSSPKHTLNISPDEARCSSTFLEKRKRSLAHNSDDEVRHLLENHKSPYHHNMLAPVNFRTSPPLDQIKPPALKPSHRNLLQGTSILLNHSNKNEIRPTDRYNKSPHQREDLMEAGRGIENIRICDDDSPTSVSISPSLSYEQSGETNNTGPPSKIVAISPRRRQQKSGYAQSRHDYHDDHHPRHQTRLQRRPCLDFDKMQLKARSSWSGGEQSVFCW